MMYWVCYGIFNAVEFFSDILLAFWFPFYYETKVFFIIWLMSSYGNGARVFYKSVIHPELNKREEVRNRRKHQVKKFHFLSFALPFSFFSLFSLISMYPYTFFLFLNPEEKLNDEKKMMMLKMKM